MGKITTTFGEKHHQAVLVMGKTYQVVTEKRAQVANLAENVLKFEINKKIQLVKYPTSLYEQGITDYRS